MSKPKPAHCLPARWWAAIRSSRSWRPVVSASSTWPKTVIDIWWRSRNTCRLAGGALPGELTPKVKPEKQPLYRLGLKSFFEEGRSLAQISHPSVVSVLNFFRENETVYMVMNYLQGDTCRTSSSPRATSSATRCSASPPSAPVRRDPARLAHRAPAQDAAPGHQAGEHLHHQRQQGGADRLRRGARSAEQGRQLHPPDVHAGLRRARDVPPRRHMGPVDRHLRDRRLHLCLHAGLSAQRRAAAHREGPPRARSLAPAQHLFRQPDRGDGVVHVARSAVAPAERVSRCRRSWRARPSAATPS